MRKILALAVLPLVVSTPLWAKTYYCELVETGSPSGFIARDMYVTVSPDKSEIVVQDGVMQYFKMDSVNAKVGTPSAAGLVFRWRVQTINSSQESTFMEYRATLSEETLKIRVHAKPTGYSNDFEGRGTCVLK